MEYKLVYNQGSSVLEQLRRLEKEVNSLCEKGWNVQGGVSVAVKNYDWCYVCQAMVKH